MNVSASLPSLPALIFVFHTILPTLSAFCWFVGFFISCRFGFSLVSLFLYYILFLYSEFVFLFHLVITCVLLEFIMEIIPWLFKFSRVFSYLLWHECVDNCSLEFFIWNFVYESLIRDPLKKLVMFGGDTVTHSVFIVACGCALGFAHLVSPWGKVFLMHLCWVSNWIGVWHLRGCSWLRWVVNGAQLWRW